MKLRSTSVTLSRPSTVPRVWPCHVTSGAGYFEARSGLCWLETLSVYSRTISMFDRAVVSLAMNGSFRQRIHACHASNGAAKRHAFASASGQSPQPAGVCLPDRFSIPGGVAARAESRLGSPP